MSAKRKSLTRRAPTQREHLVLLDVEQITVHLKNIRRVYALRDLRRMGLSQLQRSRSGKPPCVQPLIVMLQPDGKYLAIAGHLRRAGNLWLPKAQRPRLNCLVRPYADETAMLSDMGTENGVRADPGPVSWGHYYRDRLQSGVAERVLARECGVSVAKMREMIELLTLGDKSQQLLEAGDLKLGHALPLLRIDHLPTQTKLALRVVQHSISAAALSLIVARWMETHRPDGTAKPLTPRGMTHMIKPQSLTPSIDGLPVDLPVHLTELRVLAAATCASCDIGQGLPGREQAWHIALAEAGHVCRVCELRKYLDACKLCPLAQMMTGAVKHFVKEEVTQ